jgi:hypothetical protein
MDAPFYFVKTRFGRRRRGCLPGGVTGKQRQKQIPPLRYGMTDKGPETSGGLHLDHLAGPGCSLCQSAMVDCEQGKFEAV